MEKDVASCQGAVRVRYAPLRGAVAHEHLKQPAQETSQLEFLARCEMTEYILRTKVEREAGVLHYRIHSQCFSVLIWSRLNGVADDGPRARFSLTRVHMRWELMWQENRNISANTIIPINS